MQISISKGSTLYYAIKQMPKKLRLPIYLVHDFFKKIENVLLTCQSHELAEKKLAWWSEEIVRLYHAQSTHPITQVLKNYCETFQLPQQMFSGIITTFSELSKNPIIYTEHELLLHAHQSGGLREMLVSKIFNSNESLLKISLEFGSTLRIIDIIRDLRMYLRREYILLPKDILDDNIQIKSLFQYRSTPEFKKYFNEILFSEKKKLQDLLFQIKSLKQPYQKYYFVFGNIYLKLIDLLCEDETDVLTQFVGISPFKKWWIALRS